MAWRMQDDMIAVQDGMVIFVVQKGMIIAYFDLF